MKCYIYGKDKEKEASMGKWLTRRFFLKTVGVMTATAAIGKWPANIFAEERKLVRFPEKTDLILLTSRPPQLETPLHYFK